MQRTRVWSLAGKLRYDMRRATKAVLTIKREPVQPKLKKERERPSTGKLWPPRHLESAAYGFASTAPSPEFPSSQPYWGQNPRMTWPSILTFSISQLSDWKPCPSSPSHLCLHTHPHTLFSLIQRPFVTFFFEMIIWHFNFNVYTPFTVITKYWLCSLGLTVYLCSQSYMQQFVSFNYHTPMLALHKTSDNH